MTTTSTTSARTATTPYVDLAAAMRGDLITPGDAGYDDSRAVYNGMIDKRPAAIARCRDVADVIACVRFGREHDIEIAVRGGGHNAGGLGVWDDALVSCFAAPPSTPRTTPSAPTRDAPGATSTTRPSGSAWPLPPASSRRLVWVA